MNSQSSLQFFQQVFGAAWIAQALAVAAELSLADFLTGGPRTVEELAEQAHANPEALGRLLRALSGVGVFAQDAQGRYSLTPLAEMLRTGVPESQRALAVLMGGEFHETWAELLHSVRTGEPGFQRRFGKAFFQHMVEHPDRHALYDAAMMGIHGRETRPMLEAYDFSGLQTVVDVGGGNGSLLAALLGKHRATRGVLYDLPAVVDRARAALAQSGVAERCQVVAGDFFSSVPAGADAYVLRHVIHDWEDAEAIRILRNCCAAMNPGAKVLVVETVIPPENEPSFGKWLDLMMLLVGGRERTEAEYDRLLSAAGLRLNRVIPTTSEVSVLEGARVTGSADPGIPAPQRRESAPGPLRVQPEQRGDVHDRPERALAPA